MQVEGITTTTEAHSCAQCGEPAEFYSPTGLLCEEDALEDAALNMWVPKLIDDSPPKEPFGRDKSPSVVGGTARDRGF